MGCCLALSLLVSVVRRAWFFVLRRQPAEVAAFAPPARRAAPGAMAPAVILPSYLVPTRRKRPRFGATVVFAGITWFLLGIVGMHVLGWFAWAQTSALLDVAFHSSGLWVAALGASLVMLQRQPARAVTV